MFQLSTLGPILAKKEIRKNEKIEITGSTSVTVGTSPYQDLLQQEGFEPEEQLEIVQCAERCGEEYCTGLFVFLNHENGQPQFGLIDSVLLVQSNKLYLVVIKCHNNGLSALYNAYAISNNFDAPPELVKVDDLKNFRTIAPWLPVYNADPSTMYLYPQTILI